MKQEQIEVVERGNAYTVLHLTAKRMHPFVVAWKYHPETHEWEQGHYFSGLGAAMAWFEEHDPANCNHCGETSCPHRGALRRLPENLGGNSACWKLWN